MKEINIPNLDLPRVVVIGCGFAGLKLVQKLDSRSYQIVLLDRNNYHTFQPLMYQVATSGLEPDSIVYPVRKVFKDKDHFHFRMTSVLNIDTENKMVNTSIGSVKYDFLVMATGAVSNFFGLEDIEKYAFPMKTLVQSLDLRSIILQNFERSLNTSDLKERESLMSFVIVGAGPTGVELAGALAELKSHVLPKDYPDLDLRIMQIHIIEAAGGVLSGMSKLSSEKALNFLKSMGVNIWLNTMVKNYDGETVKTDKVDFHTKTVIWSAGVEGAPVKCLTINPTSENRILTDEYNRIPGFDDFFAIGDVACISSENNGNGHPMLASVAEQQGSRLAKNLNLIARKKKMVAFKYKDRGTMATIGRNRAVVDLPFIKFGGTLAWLVWMFLHLMLLVSFRNRLIVFINWAWNYFNYDKGNRLIVRDVIRKK